MFAVRRRSRGGVPRKMDTEEGIDDLYPARKLEKATNREFDVAAAELMDELFDGLKPLRAHNDNLVLTRGTQEETGEYILIDLGPGYGQYNIQVDNHQSLLLVSSPITGPLEYIFLKDKQEWCSVQDGHNFKGLLMRDLIRQVNGLPKLWAGWELNYQ